MIRIRRAMILVDPVLFNVAQLGIGFFCVFFAFMSQSFIEQTVISSEYEAGHVSKQAGFTSLAIIYFVFTFSNFITPPVVAVFGVRWSMALSALAYAVFQAGFLFMNEAFLYGSSALLGLGAGIIWTAQGKYLALNSTPETGGRNSAVFWGLLQASVIAGGIYLYIQFGGMDATQRIPSSTVRAVYAVFTSITVIGAITLALLRVPSHNSDLVPSSEQELSTSQLIVSTLRLATNKRMMLYSLGFMYTGIELSFYSGIYPTCISQTLKLGSNTYQLLALNSIATGIGQTTAGFLFGILGEKTRRLGHSMIILFGSSIHLVALVATFLFFPFDAPLAKTIGMGIIQPSNVVSLAIGFLFGFGDACWNTQIFAVLVTRYQAKSAQAFALFKFYQSLLACAAFFYGTVFQLQWHVLILIIGGTVGTIGFLAAEREIDYTATSLSSTNSIGGHSD